MYVHIDTWVCVWVVLCIMTRRLSICMHNIQFLLLKLMEFHRVLTLIISDIKGMRFKPSDDDEELHGDDY